MMDGQVRRAKRRSRPLTLADPQVARRILGREFEAARQALVRERAGRQPPPAEAQLDFLAWSCRIPTARGLPLDFDRFPFQPELYRVFGDPQVKEAVLMKGTQVGASELLVRLALYFPDMDGLTALYVFAAERQLRDFSVMRVDRLLEHSPYLRGRKREPWNRGLKTIGDGQLVLRGSQSKNDLLAVAADILLTDEYDSLVRANIPEAEQRVRGSLLGLIRRIGVPSDPEYGIGKLYRESDQRSWQVDCGACGERQPLAFDENVRWEEDTSGLIVNPLLVCRRRCGAPLDVRHGRWIPTFPERSRPGFHVNRLMVHGADLTPLIEESKRRESYLVQNFYNNGLGLPYSSADIGLDRTTIAAAVSAGTSYNDGHPLKMVQGYSGPGLVTAGIDVASTRALNIRISLHLDSLDQPGHRKRALHIGTADDFNELVRLLHRYNVNLAVIDAQPEQRSALGLANTFPGRVYLCHYSANQRDPLKLDHERHRLTANRTIAIDATLDLIRSQRNLLPAQLPPDYIEHLIAARRRVTKDELDNITVSYQNIGADDYLQAEVFDLLATETAKHLSLIAQIAAHNSEYISLRDDLILPHPTDPLYYNPGPGGLEPEYHPGFDDHDERDEWE